MRILSDRTPHPVDPTEQETPPMLEASAAGLPPGVPASGPFWEKITPAPDWSAWAEQIVDGMEAALEPLPELTVESPHCGARWESPPGFEWICTRPPHDADQGHAAHDTDGDTLAFTATSEAA